jgi:hypothetical protein
MERLRIMRMRMVRMAKRRMASDEVCDEGCVCVFIVILLKGVGLSPQKPFRVDEEVGLPKPCCRAFLPQR